MEKSPSTKQNKITTVNKKEEKKEVIWWRPLTIEGIEGITLQVDTVIKQFHDLHLSAKDDPESALVVEEFVTSIEKRINELSRFYKENKGDERAILFELQSLKLRQLFRAWGNHTSHNCIFADVPLTLTSAPSLSIIQQQQKLITAFNNPFTPISTASSENEQEEDQNTIPEETPPIANEIPPQPSNIFVSPKRTTAPRAPPKPFTPSSKKGYVVPPKNESPVPNVKLSKEMTALAEILNKTTVANNNNIKAAAAAASPTSSKAVTSSPSTELNKSNETKTNNNHNAPAPSNNNHNAPAPSNNNPAPPVQIIAPKKSPVVVPEKIKRVKLFKPKRIPKNFIKENIKAFRASSETKKWYKEFTDKEAENPSKKRKPLYYWEMDDYCKKTPTKVAENSVPESLLQTGDAEDEVVMAEFQVLLSKQEVEELLERREKLIQLGVLSALQTHPFLQKHVGKLAYGTNTLHVRPEHIFLHSSGPYIDTYTAQTVSLRHIEKQKWFVQQDFLVFPKPEIRVEKNVPSEKNVVPTQKEVITDDDVVEKRFPFMELSFVPPK